MGRPFWLDLRSFFNIFKAKELSKCYSSRRKYPVNPKLADELPVFSYPIRSEDLTSVHVWGRGEHGALGYYLQKKKKLRGREDERFKTFNRPLRLTFAELNKVSNIAAGYGFTLFVVKSSGGDTLFGTGINTDSQLGFHEPRKNAPLGALISPAPISLPVSDNKLKIKDVSGGRAHSAIVTESGEVLTLGNNAYGQCGRNIVDDERYTGSHVVHRIPNLSGEKAHKVECGQDHTLVLTESGKLFACGWGADGQTGLGHFQSCGTFSNVQGDIKGEKIVKISSKADCVLALNDKGDVFGWGNSEYSQLLNEGESGQQVNIPIILKKCAGFGKIVDVAAAGSHCLMLNEEGHVFSWGYGVLGQGPAVQQSWKPRQIPSILFGKTDFRPDSRVVSIYTGLSFSAAITNSGDVYTWGKNKSCCLGLGDDKDQFFPLRVALSLSAITMSLGVDHTVCLTKA